VTLRADLYWSFRSPYSYFAIGRYRAMTEAWDLEIALKPVYPLAIRQPDFFERSHSNWLGYVGRDVARLSQYLGVPIARPRPDPIVQDRATRRIADEQPYIFRLVRLGQAAARRGRALEFCDEVADLIWGGIENWHEGDHLARAAERAGLGLAELDAEALADAEGLDAELAENQAALEAAGHWGVPTLVFMGEPFFGQDRIDVALWQMKQAGLAPRTAWPSLPRKRGRFLPLKH
jgi:2-hydroxychromene-2-carboxylate isomerase